HGDALAGNVAQLTEPLFERLPERPAGGITEKTNPPGVPSTYSSDRLTPHAGGIRDGVHPRVAPPPPCPGSAPAHSAARAHLWPALSVSGSRYSSRRSSTGSLEDAVRRSRRRGPGIHVESSQSRARHRRFATASGAQ